MCVPTGTRFFPEYLSRERVQGLDDRAQTVRTHALSAMKVLHRQQLLDYVHPRLALPAPAADAAAAGASGAQPAEPTPVQAVVPTQPLPGPAKSVRGCAHLCEVLACRLPPERFWENSRGGGNKAVRDGSGGSGDRGSRKALTRA